MSGKAISTVPIDNARARVTERRFASGAATGFHTHARDHMVVPLTTGRLKLVEADGSAATAKKAL